MQKGFYIDLSRCSGCEACTTSCISWNNLEIGMRWVRVAEVESGRYPDVKVATIPIPCQHCGDPKCMKACPENALSKRQEDGIVLVDQDKCIGCRQCLIACPFGVPQFGKNGLMQKCNFCLDRTVKGMAPACVAACPMRAMYSGTMEELADIATTKAGKKLAGAVIDRSLWKAK